MKPPLTGDTGDDTLLSASAAEWSQRIAQTRSVPSSGERVELERQYALCQPAFRQLVRRAQEIVGQSWLRKPEFAAVAHIAQQGLEISKLLYVELGRLQRPDEELFTPAQLLNQMLESNLERMDRLQLQFGALTLLCERAAELHHSVGELLDRDGSEAEPLTMDSLKVLAQKLISGLPQDQLASAPRLLPSLAIARLTEIYGSAVRANVYAVGIAVAEVVARVNGRLWLREDRTELGVSAALLQDAGCLVLNPEYFPGKQPRSAHARRMFEQHPAVGASLVVGLNGFPLELGRLIAQHHEHLDGSGYPRSCKANEQNELSRLLSAACRHERLRQIYETADEILTPSGAGDLQAARKLLAEASRGAFDTQLVRKLLADRDQKLLDFQERQFGNSSIYLHSAHAVEGAPEQAPPRSGKHTRRDQEDNLAEREPAITARRTPRGSKTQMLRRDGT